MKKRLLAIFLAVCMTLVLLPTAAFADEEASSTWADAVTAVPAGYTIDESAKTVSISTAEGLAWFAKEINSWESKTEGQKVSFAGYTINITADIDLSGKLWIPIDASTVKLNGVTEQQKIDRDQSYNNKLLEGATINGNNHTISNMVVKTTVRGPRYESIPGDGQNSYYYAGFIGRTTGSLTIQDLTFTGASVDASKEQFVKEHGGSSMAVIAGYYGGGTLMLDNVTLSDCFVDGMQKVGGYVGQCAGSVTIDKCAVVNSTFRSLYQCAPVIAYAMNNQYNNDDGSNASKRANTLTINGIKLEDNSVVIVKDAETTYKTFGDNVDTWYYTTSGGYSLWCGNQADTVLIAQDRFSPVSGTTDAVADMPLTMAAEVGGYQYDTLSAAAAAAKTDDTITLLKDVTLTEDVNFTHSVNLVMNGYDISIPNTLSKTLWVCDGVTLTIEGDDASVITGSIGFPANIASGHLILNGGTYTANLSNDAMIYVNGTIQGENCVTIDISDATLNSTDDTFYLAGNSITSVTDSIINGYTGIYMKAGTVNLENTVINATGAYAEPVPNGNGASSTGDGIIMDSKQGYNGNMILNLGQGVKITSTNAYAVREALTDLSESSTVSVSITDGAYAGASDKAALVFSEAFNTAVNNGQATRSITNGYFTSDPSDYISDEKLAALAGSYVVDGVTYGYKIGEALPDDITVAAGDTEVNNPNNVDEAVVEKIAEAAATGISDAANEVAADLKDEDKATADKFNAAAADLVSGIPDASDTVTTAIAPRLDITVTAYDGTKQTLTLDIKAVYDIKATTAADDNPLTEWNGKTDGESNAASVNTVTIQKNAGTLNTTGTEVVITIPLPAGFVSSTGDSVYVTHVKDNGSKYVYKATVTGDATNGFAATFTNLHGFSSFTLTTETAASITDNGVTTYYNTLQDAVDAVANNGTIILLKDVDPAEVVTVSKDITFTVDTNSKTFDQNANIVAGSNTTVTVSGDASPYTYTFDYTAPSGGGSTSYSITVQDAAYGTVVSSSSRASRGTAVTITVTPDEGYALNTLTVTDTNGNKIDLKDKGDGKYTFTMPASRVTVSASFALEALVSSLPFTDVAVNDYFYAPVKWAVENGITAGTSATTFSPNTSCTRAQTMTFLWKAAGSPEPSGTANPFTNVAPDAYYYKAVLWAVENGITAGTSDTTFSPDQTVTRGQTMTFLYRAAGSPAAPAHSFTDVTAADYYNSPVGWAVSQGITVGTGGRQFSPSADCTRGQIMTFLYNANT